LEITFSTFSFSFLAHFLHCSLSSNFSCSIIPWDGISHDRTDAHSGFRTSNFSCWALASYHYNYKFSQGNFSINFTKN
jgi:hypothetical protein